MKCNYQNCNIEVVSGYEKCVLHREETNTGDGKIQLIENKEFYETLLEYIVDDIYKIGKHQGNYSKQQFMGFFTGGEGTTKQGVLDIIKTSEVCLVGINFPEKSKYDSWDCFELMTELQGVHFDSCRFSSTSLKFDKTKVFFQDCVFTKDWHLTNTPLLENVDGYMYQNCSYKGNVSLLFDEDQPHEIFYPVFNHCRFEKEILLENTRFMSNVFSNEMRQEFSDKVILMLYINNCSFDTGFFVRQKELESLIISQSQFKSEVWFLSCAIHNFKVSATDLNGVVDFQNSKFREFKLSHSVFKDFVSYEGCIFGTDEQKLSDAGSIFDFVTFLGFCSFRSATFKNGLDLRRTSMKESPIFLDAKIEPRNSDRETFRLVKQSFDKVGNYIEGNKYYIEEMGKYREELKTQKLSAERFIFEFYRICSSFGQSITRPILFILLVTLFHALLNYSFEQNWIYLLPSAFTVSLEFIAYGLNYITKNILPVNKFLVEGMEFLSLCFYILYTTLIWLIIIAIKRKTKR